MTQQEHGRDAFMALLREAAAETQAPLQAWSLRIGTLVRTALPTACLAATAPEAR